MKNRTRGSDRDAAQHLETRGSLIPAKSRRAAFRPGRPPQVGGLRPGGICRAMPVVVHGLPISARKDPAALSIPQPPMIARPRRRCSGNGSFTYSRAWSARRSRRRGQRRWRATNKHGARRLAHRKEPERAQDAAHEEHADRREPVDEGAGALAADRHEAVDPGEDEDAGTPAHRSGCWVIHVVLPSSVVAVMNMQTTIRRKRGWKHASSIEP